MVAIVVMAIATFIGTTILMWMSEGWMGVLLLWVVSAGIFGFSLLIGLLQK